MKKASNRWFLLDLFPHIIDNLPHMKQGIFTRIKIYLFGEFEPKKLAPIWKIEREENLGSYTYYGNDVYDMQEMYRIAVYERDLISGATRIRERTDMFPVNE